jgi:hypothetical protein
MGSPVTISSEDVPNDIVSDSDLKTIDPSSASIRLLAGVGIGIASV